MTLTVGQKQDLTLTVKAVLARFDGRRYDAMRYCLQMTKYPHLADEYKSIGAQIAELASNERCARAQKSLEGKCTLL